MYVSSALLIIFTLCSNLCDGFNVGGLPSLASRSSQLGGFSTIRRRKFPVLCSDGPRINLLAAANGDHIRDVYEKPTTTAIDTASRNATRKLVPLGLMLFFMLFNYTILRDTKDVLVVTAPDSGAEIIPFLKTYVNLPSAVGFTVLYSALCNRMSSSKVFYLIMAAFLSFFGAFAGFVYPNREFLHPHASADWLLTVLPPFTKPLVSIFRHWTYALFYTLANMWGTVGVSLLFWGFANDITTVDEAKKYYPLFGLMANVALVLSGQYVQYVSGLRTATTGSSGEAVTTTDPWAQSLQLLMAAVVAGGVAVIGLRAYMEQQLQPVPGSQAQQKRSKPRDQPKLSIGESAKLLLHSPHLRHLATLVIAYGVSINIVEVVWKSRLRAAFPDPNAYSAFMGQFSSATGVATLLMMLVGRDILGRWGWGVAALVTPITLFVTGMAFFALIMFPAVFQPLADSLGTSPLLAAVAVGAAQNVLSKAAKYSLFDPCKEMAYIPLDAESKSRGKAAVEVVGAPLGKSGGSLVQQVLIASCGSLQAATPYLAGTLALTIACWVRAAQALGRLFGGDEGGSGGGVSVVSGESNSELSGGTNGASAGRGSSSGGGVSGIKGKIVKGRRRR